MSINQPSQGNSDGLKNSESSAIYKQVVQATQSGMHVTELETDLLRTQVYQDRGSNDPSQIVEEPESGATHRIDTQHDVPAQSHLALRLEKFMQLSAKYAKPSSVPVESVEPTEPELDNEAELAQPVVTEDEEEAISDSTFEENGFDPDTTEWTESSRLKAVGFQLKQIRDRLDAAIGSQTTLPDSGNTNVRIDQPQTLGQNRFHALTPDQAETEDDLVDQDTEAATPVSTGIVWEVDAFHWPEVSQQLIGDGSLAIDKLGNNAIKLMGGVQNRLIVTGTKRGEGVSTIACSLAQWASSLGHRVLLIDGDLENAGLTRTLGLDGTISWTRVANQQCKIGEALVLGQASGIYLMPLASVLNRGNYPSDLYSELGKIVDPISDCFNLIIIDVGPSRQLTQETNRIDLVGDATMLVNDVSRTLVDEFEKNKSNLLAYGISKMLVAENFTRDQAE